MNPVDITLVVTKVRDEEAQSMNLKAEIENITAAAFRAGWQWHKASLLPQNRIDCKTQEEQAITEATTRLLKLFRDSAMECVPPKVTKPVPNYPNREKLLGYREGRNKTVKDFRTNITEATK